LRLAIFAINNIGVGLSGGDTIWTSLAKHWVEFMDITVIGSEEAIETAREYCPDTRIMKIPICEKIELKDKFSKWSIFKNTLYKLWHGVRFALFNDLDCDLIYSVSDFLPDMIPVFMIKLFNPRIKWIAGFYLFCPSPWAVDNPYKNDRFRGIAYWLCQRVSYPIIRKFADVVFVTSDSDKDKFPRTVVVKGGVYV